MKRQIKFRGKRTDTGEWIYGYYLEFSLCDGEGQCSYIKIDGCHPIKALPDTVGQFIGLLDDNKREIYDGDIVIDSDGRIGQVCWDDEFLQWLIMYGDEDVERCMIGFSCKVIGNVFDNSELLKGGEE